MPELAMNQRATESTHRLLHAAAVCDATGISAAPGAVLTRGGRVVRSGSLEHLEAFCERHGISPTIEKRWRSHLLVPALVNAHAHLDLTHAPATPYRGNFTAWLEHIISHRTQDPALVREAVRHGLELSRAAGVGVVGDVAGSRTAVEARMAAEAEAASGSPEEQRGVSFLECFGIGNGGVARLMETAAGLLDVEPACGVRRGLSPHAPYSVSPEAYDAAAAFARRHGLPLQTHAAETAEEIEFTQNATGSFAAMLQRLGRWESHTKGTGQHPIDLLANRLSPPASLVHCNVAEQRHFDVLARSGLAVV
ncbi:MAG: amidohydrolase family protein, partial [Phycisphaeraceae bacterium]